MKSITKKIVLPDWTRWLAQNCNGSWYAYEFLPVHDDMEMAWHAPDGKEELICDGVINKATRSTLTRIV